MKSVPCPKCSSKLEWEDDEPQGGGACNQCVIDSLPRLPLVFEVTDDDGEIMLLVAHTMQEALDTWKKYTKLMEPEREDDAPEPVPSIIKRLEGRALDVTDFAFIQHAFVERTG